MSTGLRFTLEVDGLPPDAFAVVSFHLNQSLSSLFSLDLSLVSQQFLSLEFAQVLDKMAPAAVACRSAPELPYLPERGHQKHPRHDVAGKRGDRMESAVQRAASFP